MEIKVIDSGCCSSKIDELIEAAVKELGIDVHVVKITEIAEIARLGILSTPGLIINGKIKHSGKPLPNIAKIKELIQSEK